MAKSVFWSLARSVGIWGALATLVGTGAGIGGGVYIGKESAEKEHKNAVESYEGKIQALENELNECSENSDSTLYWASVVQKLQHERDSLQAGWDNCRGCNKPEQKKPVQKPKSKPKPKPVEKPKQENDCCPTVNVNINVSGEVKVETEKKEDDCGCDVTINVNGGNKTEPKKKDCVCVTWLHADEKLAKYR